MHYMCVLVLIAKMAMLVYVMQSLTEDERPLGCCLLPLFLMFDRMYSPYDPDCDWNSVLLSVYTCRTVTYIINEFVPSHGAPPTAVVLLTITCGIMWTSMCWYCVEHKKLNPSSPLPMPGWVQWVLAVMGFSTCAFFVSSVESEFNFTLRVAMFCCNFCLIHLRVPVLSRDDKVFFVLPILFVPQPVNGVYGYMLCCSEANPRPYVYPVDEVEEGGVDTV